MKEHFNVVKPISEGPKDLGFLNVNSKAKRPVAEAPAEDKTGTLSLPDDTLQLDAEAWYKSGIKEFTPDLSEVADMDYEMALDGSRFVRDMARGPEGRSNMSLAHNTISPHKVLQLFDF